MTHNPQIIERKDISAKGHHGRRIHLSNGMTYEHAIILHEGYALAPKDANRIHTQWERDVLKELSNGPH